MIAALMTALLSDESPQARWSRVPEDAPPHQASSKLPGESSTEERAALE